MASPNNTDLYPSDNERVDDIPDPPDNEWYEEQLTQLSKPKPSYTKILRQKGFQLSSSRYRQVITAIDEVVRQKQLFLDLTGGWRHEAKIEDVKSVLQKRFQEIDNVMSKDPLKIVWGEKILAELISRRITSQRTKTPTPTPSLSKRKLSEGAKESPTKKAKTLLMPAVNLIIKDEVVPGEPGSAQPQIKKED
jgi:hypothetical protein